MANAMAGVCAEAVAVFSFLPTDVVSQRLQIQQKYNFFHLKYQSRSATKIIGDILKTEGLGGFFRGIYPYLIVFGPGSAIWWASYEWAKGRLDSFHSLQLDQARSFTDRIMANAAYVLCGSFAGVCSVLVTNPLDVMRTRLQLLEYKNKADNDLIRAGFTSVLRQVYRNEGLSGLYKGIKPRVFIKVPGSAIAFLGYEYLKEFSTNKAPISC